MKRHSPTESPTIPRGRHSRGYLPHIDGGSIWQFITLHLADAMPQPVLDRWKQELEHEPEEKRKLILYRRLEKYLDQGYGSCYLGQPNVAEQVQESILHRVDTEYDLRTWVVMPNHIHFLIRQNEGLELEDIMQAFKSYTAHKCNRLLARAGQFWQVDYFDRFIRDIVHFRAVVRYIAG
jgi:REP element-mobilizing transposase RayT